MLLSQNFLFFALLHFKADKCLSTPIHCPSPPKPPNKNSSIQTVHKPQQLIYLIKILLVGIFVTVIWLQIFVALIHPNSFTTSVLLQSLYYPLSMTINIAILMVHYHLREDMANLFDGLLRFERLHNYLNWTPLESKYSIGRRMKVYMLFGATILPTAVSAYWLQLSLKPCFPGNFGYFLIPKCNTLQWSSSVNSTINFDVILTSYFLPMALASLSAWIASQPIGAVLRELITYSALHVHCFKNYLLLFRKKLINLQLKSQCQFSNSYLQRKSYLRLTILYRQIQLLVNIFNDIHQMTLVIAGISVCTVTLCLSLFLLIRLYGELILPQIVLFGCLALAGVMTILELDGGLKAKVYLTSMQIKKQAGNMMISGGGCGRSTDLFRRYVKSWSVIKIGIGNAGNYYGATTPMLVLDFVVNLTASLLMMEF